VIAVPKALYVSLAGRLNYYSAADSTLHTAADLDSALASSLAVIALDTHPPPSLAALLGSEIDTAKVLERTQPRLYLLPAHVS
jgi:hypothetical protein